MRYLFAFLFLILFYPSYAGTGSANDVVLFYLVIIGIFAIPLSIYFIIDFIRKIVKKRKEKRIAQTIDDPDNNDEPQSL